MVDSQDLERLYWSIKMRNESEKGLDEIMKRIIAKEKFRNKNDI